MKVIVFLNSMYTGGAEYSTLAFYSWLLRKGYVVKLVCYKIASPSYSWREFGFSEIVILEGNSFFKKLKAFNKLVKEFNPDVVHSVLFQANILARFSRFSNSFIHLESLVTEMYSLQRLADPNISRMKLEAYRVFDLITQFWGVDHFHSNGESVAVHYRNKLKINATRITVIPRGRTINPFVGNTEVRAKLRNELKTGNRLMAIQVASHGYPKGHDVLLDALNQLGHLKENIQVVLVGREGTQTEAILKSIKIFKLEKVVAILGHRNDISSLLIAADIFVFPSRLEGLPGALIEAEAAGLPIVCSDIQNNKEVVEENKNALLFSSGNPTSLADSMKEMISDQEMRERFGKNSTKIFMTCFRLEAVHERMLGLLKRLSKRE